MILAVQGKQQSDWLTRISNDTDFSRLRNIHTAVIVAKFWTKSLSATEIRNSYMITKLITEIPGNTVQVCVLCGRDYLDMYKHACCNCTCRLWLEEVFWCSVIEHFHLDVFLELSFSDEEEFYKKLATYSNIRTFKHSKFLNK